MKKIIFSIFIFGFVGLSEATNWYVDNAVASSGNGQSWASAWKYFSDVVWGASGVKAGDTLFISGGSVSKTYTESWAVGADGTANNPITIAIDSSNPNHSGVAIFDYDVYGDAGTINAISVSNRSYVTISGNVNGENHIVVQNLRNILDGWTSSGISGNPTTGITLDHLTFKNMNNPVRLYYSTGYTIRYSRFEGTRGDGAISVVAGTGVWDTNKVYGNYIEGLYNTLRPAGNQTPYSGPDGVQCGDGISIYNNVFRVKKTTLITSTQHPDMVQSVGSFTKIYNNEFINVGDSSIDMAGAYADPNPHDIWIYNNLFRIEETVDPYPEYIRFYTNDGNPLQSFNNIKILNNTFVDNSNWANVTFRSMIGNPTAVGNEIKNNLFYNCGQDQYRPVIAIDDSSGFTANSFSLDGNLYSNPSIGPIIYYRGTNFDAPTWVSQHEPHGKVAPPSFVQYVANSPSNNYQLSGHDIGARNAGLSLANYFTTDKDGVSRPQGSAWDIGAYETQLAINHLYTVCSSGCDSPTIQGVFNAHVIGSDDVIEVRADSAGGSKIYREVVHVSGGGAVGHPAILRARAGDTITIDSQNAVGNTLYLDANYFVVDGIHVQGSQGSQILVGQVGSTCRATRDVGLTVQNSFTHAASPDGNQNHEGIMVNCANSVLLKNNKITTAHADLGPQDSDCFFASQFDGLTVEGNTCVISNTASVDPAVAPHNDGIQIMGGNGINTPLGGTKNVTIRNNIFSHDANRQGYKQCIFVEYEVQGIVDISNNTCLDTTNANDNILLVTNKGYGTQGQVRINNNSIFVNGAVAASILTDEFVPNPTIKNNISLINGTNDYESCVAANAPVVAPSGIDYNLCFNKGSSVIMNRISGQFYTWSNWLAAGFNVHGYQQDPKFLNAAVSPYDLHLTAGSIAVDHGSNLSSLFTADLEGAARPQGAAWDMGAYEFNGALSVSIPHPADTNSDYLIILNEATKYAACWKNPTVFADCATGIPMDYAVRAGTLWVGSANGQYQYNSSKTCPLCWEIKP